MNFGGPGARTAGITFDVSRSGLFVRTVHLPKIGSVLDLIVHLTDGAQIALAGKVVRTFSAVGKIRFVIPSGFGLRVSSRSEDYEKFVASLFGSPAVPAAKGAPPRVSDPVQLLAWVCRSCGRENFKTLAPPIPLGKDVPVVCRGCEGVGRRMLLPPHVIPGRRRSPRV